MWTPFLILLPQGKFHFSPFWGLYSLKSGQYKVLPTVLIKFCENQKESKELMNH